LEGLEITEVSASRVIFGTVTKRIDPEYFRKVYLHDEEHIASRPNDFCGFDELGVSVDASAFYPSIENYYGEGDLPFLRVADVDSIIDFQACTTIPEHLCDLYPTLAKVLPGDILLTKGGSIARVGLVSQKAAASRDLIFLNSSKLSREDHIFLYLYFQSGIFNRSLLRSSSQTAQPHLTITLVRELRVFRASQSLKANLMHVAELGFNNLDKSTFIRDEAEKVLLRTIGLENWKSPEPLSYVRRSCEAFAAGRLDAEHFQPKYTEIIRLIKATNQFQSLNSLVLVNQRGTQPIYTSSGTPVVNSKHVINGEVRIDADNRLAMLDKYALKIEPGDVLINGTGVGTIGRAAPYLHGFNAIPDNHVTVLRPCRDLIDPIYLAVFLNSLAGRMQVEQRLRGSSGQIEIYPSDLGQFTIWVAPTQIQQEIRNSVLASFAAKQKAKQLLDAAKRVVEIAIESSESDALAFLDQTLTEAGEANP